MFETDLLVRSYSIAMMTEMKIETITGTQAGRVAFYSISESVELLPNIALSASTEKLTDIEPMTKQRRPR